MSFFVLEFSEFSKNVILRQISVEKVTKTLSETVDDMVAGLSLFVDKALKKGKTYIFFDEIQEFKELAMKIKFWVDEASFKYIFSSSLLGVELKNIKSAPVGYLTTYTIYPLDFVIEYNGNALPIEVKSGKSYRTHSALSSVMNIENYSVKEAFVLTNYNVEVVGNVVYYTIHMLMFINNDNIKRQKLSPLIYPIQFKNKKIGEKNICYSYRFSVIKSFCRCFFEAGWIYNAFNISATVLLFALMQFAASRIFSR